MAKQEANRIDIPHLINWIRKNRAGRVYEYTSADICALAQYAQDGLGFPKAWAGSGGVYVKEDDTFRDPKCCYLLPRARSIWDWSRNHPYGVIIYRNRSFDKLADELEEEYLKQERNK